MDYQPSEVMILGEMPLRHLSFVSQEITSYETKMLHEDMHSHETKNMPQATV